MRKIAAFLLLLSIILMCSADAFAGGNKNCGDKGKGTVTQTQVRVKK